MKFCKNTYLFAVAAVILTIDQCGFACSELFLNKGGYPVSARNMDFSVEMYPLLVLSPRGIVRTSYNPKAGDTPLQWTAQYGSIGIYLFHYDNNNDGMNEYGLSGALLWNTGTQYPIAQSDKALSFNYWVQYYLDNYKTVAEAVAAAPYIKVYPIPFIGLEEAPIHMVLHDPTGDSAVMEYDGLGDLHIYRPSDISNAYNGVTTNDPGYPEQLANLLLYKPWGGLLDIPGGYDSMSRFVRGSSILKTMPTPSSAEQANGYAWAYIQNLAHPAATVPPGQPEESRTIWTVVRDHSNLSYQFHTLFRPGIRWVDLSELDFTEGQSMKAQALDDSYEGDVSDDFTAIKLNSVDGSISYKRLSINPSILKSGYTFSFILHLGENITESFDLYVLAETGGRTYTLGFNGKTSRGIQALYSNVPGYPAPYESIVTPSLVIPTAMAGQQVSFYVAAIEAGKRPPVQSLSDLVESTAYVIMMDRETMTIK